MPSNYPAAVDALTRVIATDELGTPGKELDVVLTKIQEAVESVQGHVGKIGETAPTTIEARLSAVEGSTGPSLVASGKAGGQTLIGGLSSTESLTLQGTAGNGSATTQALRLKVGNNGSLQAVAITNTGSVGIGVGSSPGTTSITAFGGAVTANNQIAEKVFIADPTVINYGRITQAIFDLSADTTLNHIANLLETTVSASNTHNFGASSTQYAKVINTKIEGSGSTYRVKNLYNRLQNYSGQCRYLAAVENYVDNYSSVAQTVGSNAIYGRVYNGGGGLIPTAWGCEASIYNGLGSMTQANLFAASVTNSAGQTIDTIYGMNIGGPGETWSNLGTINNCTGLIIGSSTNTGTNRKAIDCQSPADSYFAGSAGFGVFPPSARIHALSTSTQLCLGYDASNSVTVNVSSVGTPTWTTTSQKTVLAGSMGIGGTSDPKAILHVTKGLSGSASPNAQSSMVLETNGGTVLNLLAPSNSYAAIYAGDETANSILGIEFTNSAWAGVVGTNAINFKASGNSRLRVNNSAVSVGTKLQYTADSSTTSNVTQADMTPVWLDSTHATRKARLDLNVWDTVARLGIRMETDGSVVKMAFFGKTTAVPRPTALTASVAASPAGGTGTAAGGWDSAANRDLAIATINNLKTRVDELESKLQAAGLLS